MNAGTPIPLDTHPPEHSSPWNTHPPGTLIPLELPSPWNTHPPWNYIKCIIISDCLDGQGHVLPFNPFLV